MPVVSSPFCASKPPLAQRILSPMTVPAPLRNLLWWWLGSLLLWGLITLGFATQLVFAAGVEWQPALIASGREWAPWGIFSPLVVALALALQLLVEPKDLAHLGVNMLSLGLPLVAMHLAFGRRLFGTSLQERFTLGRVLKLDLTYYAGVAAMVAFWLGISNDPLPVRDWASWALAYMPVFAGEAMLSFGAVMVLRQWQSRAGALARHTEIGRLRFG